MSHLFCLIVVSHLILMSLSFCIHSSMRPFMDQEKGFIFVPWKSSQLLMLLLPVVNGCLAEIHDYSSAWSPHCAKSILRNWYLGHVNVTSRSQVKKKRPKWAVHASKPCYETADRDCWVTHSALLKNKQTNTKPAAKWGCACECCLWSCPQTWCTVVLLGTSVQAQFFELHMPYVCHCSNSVSSIRYFCVQYFSCLWG